MDFNEALQNTSDGYLFKNGLKYNNLINSSEYPKPLKNYLECVLEIKEAFPSIFNNLSDEQAAKIIKLYAKEDATVLDVLITNNSIKNSGIIKFLDYEKP